ncbi:hypothetical protein N7539_006322 [Penicillium diatomitis]|uniref:ubiquitinyl hydrolase 1 n=1 Tax=Penicillium diatomitis TaxID=2819901 RepID=A0A9X0BSX7_9EURO|nr:uncharacterized protein N7539_006322 [Penicillium diatomitis]KAJ5482876.1 hypothetical protein N7539_006322 [Penicillium diatomitis]
MVPPQRPGKTAPRLAEDIKLYDPAHLPGTGLNLLSQVPPVHPKKGDKSTSSISPDACRHEYVTKDNQTSLLSTEERRRPGASCKVAAICSKCRCHLQVVVNYTSGGSGFAVPMPGEHLHHFVYQSGRQSGHEVFIEGLESGQVEETYHYQCSRFSCATVVSIRILSPLLTKPLVRLLCDSSVIHARASEAIAAQPERLEGMAIPEPITVLDNLRLYLHNALHVQERSKAISSSNKRFMLSFGLEGAGCRDVLEYLGFAYDADAGSWQPPSPKVDITRPYYDAGRVFIDDILIELLCLLHQRPAAEKKGVNIPALPAAAYQYLASSLEALTYSRSPRAHEFGMASDSFYEDLGVVEDMDARSIVNAYQSQVALDPRNAPLYLQSLKGIALVRRGEDFEILNQAIEHAYAEGKFTDDDLLEAWHYFGYQPLQQVPKVDDDALVGKFYAYLSSLPIEKQDLPRLHLWRIGFDLGSERLMAVSQGQITTVEQAYDYLGAPRGTPDDFILTMYTAKLNDDPACVDLANRAVQIIASARNSTLLKHFLDTGEALAGDMDIGEAYRRLQIPDRTVDDGAIMAAYTICVDENPGQVDTYNRALTVIAKAMDSAVLRQMAGISNEPDRKLSDWPVGLQNIGNTCYLNSLLQFYFSVRPFRDMVLHYENHQMDVNDDEGISKKQVGSRKVAKKEVERSLKFMSELRGLFNSMITSRTSSVAPGQELARLTLISPGGEAAIRRRSTISRSHTLGEVDGRPVLGPLGPPQPILEEGSDAQITSDSITPAPTSSNVSEVGSDATLVSEPTGSADDTEMKDANVEDAVLLPAESDQKQRTGDPTDAGANLAEIPARPPPVPPRPSLTSEDDRRKQLIEEVEIGAQQDVTEVINNVLFQSQCAIRPLRIEPDGEQGDQIKDLFYGCTRSYISTAGGTRSKEERWCDIKVDVAGGPRDIYAAIDGAFDAQKISVENGEAEQYGSITRIPPILQIQVQRVQFDPVQKRSFKSTNHLGLYQTIYLDRYMDTTRHDIMSRRRQCWAWKSKLRDLESRRAVLLRKQENEPVAMTDLFRATRDALEGISKIQSPDKVEIDATLLGDLDQICETVQKELQTIDQEVSRIQELIKNQFSDLTKLPYQLYAVFVHHGSVSFGHYWIYIRDFQRNIWRKYNDEYVTEVQNEDEIFGNTDTDNPPTPYFLVYIRDSMENRLVDPVWRDIDEQEPFQSEVFFDGVMPMEDVQSPGHNIDHTLSDPPSYEGEPMQETIAEVDGDSK